MTLPSDSFAAVWSAVVERLVDDSAAQPRLTRQQQAWLRLARPVNLVDSVAVLTVPNAVAQEQVGYHLRDVICDALARHLGHPVDLDVRLGPDGVAGAPDSSDDRRNVPPKPPPPPTPSRFTFDTFVVGESNRFAHAAAVAVAESPALAYNPLFIWGESGLGKTHLLRAVGEYTRRLYPDLRVTYVSTEEFTNDFIDSMRDDRRARFKHRYRDQTDLLLVDDVQFLIGKESTQEEFFHTFNALHDAGKQIVLSSDRPPYQLSTLEERLRTRFQSGLTTDVSPPDLETRVAILRRQARNRAMAVPDDVLVLIASRIERNIRELQGALIRVDAYASLTGASVDLSLVEQVLADLLPEPADRTISAQRIVVATAEHFALTVDDLRSPRRDAEVTLSRQIAMYLCRELTSLTLAKIGALFNRHHSTVVHAEKKIAAQLSARREVHDHVREITAQVRREDG
jgi:chromosomal replication initiator protein